MKTSFIIIACNLLIALEAVQTRTGLQTAHPTESLSKTFAYETNFQLSGHQLEELYRHFLKKADCQYVTQKKRVRAQEKKD